MPDEEQRAGGRALSLRGKGKMSPTPKQGHPSA